MATEEGLAALNTQLPRCFDPKRNPYLFRASLLYYSAYMSNLMSFQDLNTDLSKYIDDPDDRFKQCVRVKRGY